MPASELLKTNIRPGDVINGWQVVRNIMTAHPLEVRKWRAVCPHCNEPRVVREDLMVQGLADRCQECATP